MGIKITDKDVETRLDQIKKQYFGGSEKKYQAQLKKQGLTDAQVRADIRSQLISEAVFNKVTKDVTVSDSDSPRLLRRRTRSSTRRPRRATCATSSSRRSRSPNSIYAQLKAGNDKTWCTLAKKYSQDPSSKDNCGKLTVSKGQTVPEFDKVAFSQPTKGRHAPVHNRSTAGSSSSRSRTSSRGRRRPRSRSRRRSSSSCSRRRRTRR